MNEDDLLRDTAEKEGVGDGGVATAYDDHGFPSVEHPVTGRTVRDATSDQGLLFGDSKRPGCRTGRDHDRLSEIGTGAGFHSLRCFAQLQLRDFRVLRDGTKFLRLLLHFLAQGKAVDAILKARIIIDLLGQRHLPAGGQLLQHHRVETGSRGIECGCIATRTAAHDDHIVYMIRIHRTSLLLTFAHVTCASVFSWRFL